MEGEKEGDTEGETQEEKEEEEEEGQKKERMGEGNDGETYRKKNVEKKRDEGQKE